MSTYSFIVDISSTNVFMDKYEHENDFREFQHNVVNKIEKQVRDYYNVYNPIITLDYETYTVRGKIKFTIELSNLTTETLSFDHFDKLSYNISALEFDNQEFNVKIFKL